MIVALEDDISDLQSNPVFALFDVEALRLIAFSSETRLLRRDDTLFREGDVSDGGYYIVSGALTLSSAGAEEVYGMNTLVGEAALFVETNRPASATALETTMVRRIPRHLMRRILAEFPETAARLRKHMGAKMVDLESQLTRIDQLLPGGA
jgi:CRP-like cAMP-binding protein